MPDARHPQRPLHESWHDAFASLPLEVPPARGWDAIASRLSTRKRRLPTWLAIAAALALVAVLPLRDFWRNLPGDGAGSFAASAPPAAIASPSTHPKADAGSADARQFATAPPSTTSADSAQGSSAATADARDTALAASITEAPPHRPGAQSAVAQAVEDPMSTAATTSPQPGSVPTPAAEAAPSIETASHPGAEGLDQLYAESARLEALLALARDEHVSSASAAVLGQAYDAQVATIDQALMQATLTDTQRAALWRDRVEALRQLTAFESTQRVLASWGQRDDMRLVSID